MAMNIFNSRKIIPLLAGVALSFNAVAADYKIDTKGAHASINFKIPHLGYSWLVGRFNDFEGKFTYDPENMEASTVEVTVDTTSIDSNHAERDKHLRGDDYLDTDKFGQAKFVSTEVTDKGNGNFTVIGDLTLHGVTKPITIDAAIVGEGPDPWLGYRAGFSGTTVLKLKDFGIPDKLGPASSRVTLDLYVEGVSQ
ncbi:YceI family protein [Pseudomaricurvus sp.]|uniref:YceI family protein n=1 Tax=Pseudomaricurvus sp. TaxID=2004510 RepID=UPI003F6AFD9A